LSFSLEVAAYSYISIDREPLIKGREAMLAALHTENVTAMNEALALLKDELELFKAINQVDLYPEFVTGIEKKNYQGVHHLLDRALYQSILASLNVVDLNQYQISKVMMMKCKLFLDLLTPRLTEEQRAAAKVAMYGLLDAVGDPGIFDAGKRAAEPEAFARYRTDLLRVLQMFEQ
jgi:hypothetical protein